jgi:hypothetical protein
MEIHAGRADTARIRRVYKRLRELQVQRAENVLGWVYAAVTNDDTMRARLLNGAGTWTRLDLLHTTMMTAAFGVSPEGLDQLTDRLYNDPSLASAERITAKQYGAINSFERGRPQQGWKYVAEAQQLHGDQMRTDEFVVSLALAYPEMSRDSAEIAIKRARATKNAHSGCRIALYDALNGRTREMQTSLASSAAAVPTGNESDTFHLKYCSQLARAANAVVTASGTARSELQRVDSIILAGPPIEGPEANLSAAILGQLYARLGDWDKARAASRRGSFDIYMKMPQVLELARAAARTGHREEAIRNYRIYLSYRDPEPGAATKLTDNVRAELAEVITR